MRPGEFAFGFPGGGEHNYAEGIVMALADNRYWGLLALLIAAVLSYSLGFMLGLVLFVGAGVLLELAFWIGLFKRRRRD